MKIDFLVLATCPTRDCPRSNSRGTSGWAWYPKLAIRRSAGAGVPAPDPARKNVPYWVPTSGVSSSMTSSVTVLRSRCFCIRPDMRARLVFSQSCS